MTLTLLLDLDDTLLTTRIDAFIAAYLNMLGAYLSQIISTRPEAIVHHLLAATGKMVRNDRPDRTLEEAFDEAFYPALGIPKAELLPYIDTFYSELYPGLKSLTDVSPGAARLVELAFSRGYRVAIATNPLFPRTAILQRLEWAGLSPDRCPFDLITSYEAFHYAKPSPAFFAETLAHLGCPSQPALMVGNDLDADIKPAVDAGLAAFWIGGGRLVDQKARVSGVNSGNLDDLINWLARVEPQDIQNAFRSRESVMAALQGNPGGIPALIQPIPAALRGERPHPDDWSLVEVLCHLRYMEAEVNLIQLEKILSEENPFLIHVNSSDWALDRSYRSQDPILAYEEFIQARRVMITRLKSLSPVEWDRPARHAIFGPTTLGELMSFAADHDRIHLRQLKQLSGNGFLGDMHVDRRHIRPA